MADIAKSIIPSLASTIPISGGNYLTLEAATDIAAGDMVYITSAGKFALSNGTAANALAQSWGMAARAAKAGQPLTAYHGVEFRYGSGLAPGARMFLSAATAGALADTATTGDAAGTAFATAADRIFVMSPRK